jgi:hypothetical protein
MNESTSDSVTTARVHDLARERAEDLRKDAITNLWRDLDHALASAADHSARAARRWAQRLHQHRRQREAAAICSVES